MSEDAKVSATGVVATTGVNASGTRYTEEALRKAVKDVQEDVKQRRLFGTLGPPSETGRMRLTDVSHVVKRLEFRDGVVHASIEALDTHAGRALKAMLSGQRPVRFVPEGLVVSKNKDGAITELKLTSVGVRDPDPGEKS